MTFESASDTDVVVKIGHGSQPTALIVGPMKAGTSWLYEYLKARPDVAVPSGTKETFFFDDRFDSKGADWYRSHFSHVTSLDVATIVEVAPTYFHPLEVPKRVLQTLGPIKVVVTLRDPASRAFSLFQHMRRYGYTSCTTFRDAVNQHKRILASSRYNECLHRWEEAFGADNVSVLFMEDLRADPLAFASHCCQGLGIESPADCSLFPDQVNVATTPRNFVVAKMGRVTGDILRSFRLYAIVDAAKKMGLKKLFFGKPQTVRQKLSSVDRGWFLDLIQDDLHALQSRIDRDISLWLAVDAEGAVDADDKGTSGRAEGEPG